VFSKKSVMLHCSNVAVHKIGDAKGDVKGIGEKK
jgi:hypothetical protein